MLDIEKYYKDQGISSAKAEDITFDSPTVKVYVSREQYRKAVSVKKPVDFDECYIIIEQAEPPLIPANVGDLVLIWNRLHFTEEDSAIGIVSSEIKSEDKIFYGCRHLIIPWATSYNNNSLSDFELTSENYGGYEKGFLKILLEEEAISHLVNQVKKKKESQLKGLEQRFDRCLKQIPNVFKSIKDSCKVVEIKKMVTEESYPLYIKITEDFKEPK